MVVNVKDIAEGKTGMMKKSEPESAGKSISQKIKDAIDSVAKNEPKEMSDEEKKRMLARIMAKMKRGKTLTNEEQEFLRKANPELFMQYKRIRAMAESLESSLKGATTKEEANSIIMMAFNGVSDQDPYKAYVMAALSETAKEFRDSPQFARLPNSNEDLQNDKDVKKLKPKKHMDGNCDDEQDDNSDSGEKITNGTIGDFDLSKWSPIQEIIDNQPKFHVSV